MEVGTGCVGSRGAEVTGDQSATFEVDPRVEPTRVKSRRRPATGRGNKCGTRPVDHIDNLSGTGSTLA